jgi:flagellar basal body-associated protein FliL
MIIIPAIAMAAAVGVVAWVVIMKKKTTAEKSQDTEAVEEPKETE